MCRVREVGEDVLLDMSEVLFNELTLLFVLVCAGYGKLERTCC